MLEQKIESAEVSQANELAVLHSKDQEDYITMKKNFEETEGEVIKIPN